MRTPLWSSPIETIKERVYLVVLPFATLTCLSLWWLEARNGTLHIVDRVGLPLFSLLCLALLLILRRWPKRLATCEVVLFCAFALFYLASLSYSLATFAQNPLGIWNLAGLSYWSPVLYTLAFLVFGVDRGLAVSLGVHGLLAFTTLNYLLMRPQDGAVQGTSEMLLQGFAAGAISLFLMWAIGRVVAAQTKAATQLELEAGTDPLTLLDNRRRIGRQLELEAARAQRQGGTFSVAMLDIDFFKRVNDEHGHAVGDEVLTEVSRLIRDETRAMDMVGRWGGEEFVLLLPGLPLEEAHAAVERLRLAVSDHGFAGVGHLTVSAGVAQYRAEEPLENLLQRADQALYGAKAKGRNKVVTEQNPEVYEAVTSGELLN